MEYVLGIDTSNYTTSVAAVSMAGEMLADARQLLPVAQGKRGLRQSDALFFHVQHLPQLFAQVRGHLPVTARLCGIGASVHPRPFSASYMPVFRAAESFAEVLGQSVRVPVIRTSHQEGHVQAAIETLDGVAPAAGTSFFALHLSGGTTDLMIAEETRFGYRINLIAEDPDLHVGQFVDRVGVALTLPFPAGPHLERLAATSVEEAVHIPTAVKGLAMSFSGPCSAALRMIERGAEPAAVAQGVQNCIVRSLVKVLANAAEMAPAIRQIIAAGGVASNQFIREQVRHQLKQACPTLEICFADRRYASDNAVGVAGIARRFLLGSAGRVVR